MSFLSQCARSPRHCPSLAQVKNDRPQVEFGNRQNELVRLIKAGVLGFYTHFEATEVFASRPGQFPINVFTILVADERQPDAQEKPRYLNPNPVKLNSLKGWTFGIQRYVKPLTKLVPAFDILYQTKTWQTSGDPLGVADLLSIPPQFAPPESAGDVPLNRVLKNNFWNGSHVFEWVDPDKAALKPLFDHPPVLQELSGAVQAYVPIRLASLSDRLGGIVLQLPVTVLMTKFGEMRESGDVTIEVAWHSKATPRALRTTCEMDYDGVISVN
jgi:hypothetical protein